MENTKRLTVRISEELYDRLTALKKDFGIPFTHFIVQATQEKLDRLSDGDLRTKEAKNK